MRLTNVAQMDLVAGRVFSYGVSAGAEGRALPVSFDQGLHVGAGQRPGSWMAIAFRLRAPVDRALVGAAWDAVVARHGTLQTAFSTTDDGRLELHEIAVAPGAWIEHPVTERRRTRDVLREVFDEACAPYARPSHRICLVEPDAGDDDPRPDLVIGSDHAHVDMWSLVILSAEVLACLADLEAGRAPGAALPPATAFAEHTAVLAAMPAAPAEVHGRWAAILEAGEGIMPRFPLPLGQLDPRPPEVVEVRDVLDAEESRRLAAVAKAAGVRPIAIGISVLTEVTQRLAGRPLRAVFPVHSRHEDRWRESIGWFITNAVIESADPDPVASAASVQEAIGLGSWPLAPILAAHGGGMPVAPGMFAVSWLDARRLPVPTAPGSQLRYVSAAIRTDGVMIWFAVDESGLHLRCRYPDTPEAREHVGRWLDAVQQGLRDRASG
ncbi:MAG: hypothetical protein AAGC46_17715 [Solirubrobacteraceae bacterium]|nr:hypothetical protein [Patulibacter sp.]